MDVWNENAYVINDHYHLYNTDEDDPFNQETHYQYTDKQPIKVTVDVDNNFVVDGAGTVPVPSREGYVFAGWLLEPNQLTDQCTVKAYWRNGNNTMPPEEEAMWYSPRAAEGQTKAMAVTFDANGGAFRAGQGDIHSTDFPLYRRLGDAYIINNTWVTGENTPNDPFDTTLIDTVGNTAAGKNTISNDGLTGNDVYSSSTHSGGQADMLKRLPRSTYMVGDTEFILSSIDNIRMVDSRTPERRTIESTTETFIKGTEDDFLPAESVKKDGVSWTLTDKELVDSEIEDRTKEAVVTKRYVGVEKGVPVPESIEYTYEDRDTGETINEMLSLTDQTEGSWYWIPFEFPITISGYGADTLDLNGTEIPAGADLADYSTEFLDMLGLNREYYRIDSVRWDGEPYERGGELCRNAMGTGGEICHGHRCGLFCDSHPAAPGRGGVEMPVHGGTG